MDVDNWPPRVLEVVKLRVVEDVVEVAKVDPYLAGGGVGEDGGVGERGAQALLWWEEEGDELAF